MFCFSNIIFYFLCRFFCCYCYVAISLKSSTPSLLLLLTNVFFSIQMFFNILLSSLFYAFIFICRMSCFLDLFFDLSFISARSKYFYVKGHFSDLSTLTTDFVKLMEEQGSTITEEQEVERMIKHLSITSTAFNSMIDIEGRKASNKVPNSCFLIEIIPNSSWVP